MGVIYSVFRIFDVNPFTASDLTDMVVKGTGFIAFYACARRIFRAEVWTGAIFAAVFTLWSSSFSNAYHQQLFSIAFAPVLTFVVWLAVQNRTERSWLRYVFLLMVAVLVGVWALSAFYMLWFYAFYVFALLLCGAAMAGSLFRRDDLMHLRTQYKPVVFYFFSQIICLIPFWRVYHYTSQQTGGHIYSEVKSFQPSILGMIDSGNGNLTWNLIAGHVSRYLPSMLPPQGEQVMGAAFLTFVAFSVGVLNYVKCHGVRTLVGCLSISAVLSWIVTVNFSGFSLWWLFYEGFPAAKAVRVISRYELFLAWPLCIIMMLCADDFLVRNKRFLGRSICFTIMALILVEQYNYSYPVGLRPVEEMAWLHSIPVKPATCQSFYVEGSRSNEVLVSPGIDSTYGNNVDAMFIAEMIGLPTLNGIDSFTPSGWNLVGYRDPDYEKRVEAYANKNHLQKVCALDLLHNRWKAAFF